MKFMYFPLPALPATIDERRKMRPIAYHTDRWQRMFQELVELARMAEDLGFEAFIFPEHHLATEGLEVGSIPQLSLWIAMHTKTIKVGPIGYVLPGWDPLRLAINIAWLDQLTKGRTIVGMARGYQNRWLNQMAQKIHVGAVVSDQSEVDLANRRAFEEVFQIIRLCWKDAPFRFKGEHYQYPSPFEEGTPWPPHEFTAEFGSPGELKGDRIVALDVVPKPYQKPHPRLFQAFSLSEATIRWCAKEDIVPMILTPQSDAFRHLVHAYQEESLKYGRKLERGQAVGVLRQFTIGSPTEVHDFCENGAMGMLWKRFWGHFGFWEALRVPGDPEGKMLPREEWTVERMQKSQYLMSGSVADVRKGLDKLVEDGNPEYVAWLGDQGLLPLEVCKQQMRIFGEQILPHYRS
jgi:alkanesulfonate monooxygenase SsuD/methylene tetrahydromethanopterin reductase-like flavin-dependent oxidoreductase (luciferase family)